MIKGNTSGNRSMYIHIIGLYNFVFMICHRRSSFIGTESNTVSVTFRPIPFKTNKVNFCSVITKVLWEIERQMVDGRKRYNPGRENQFNMADEFR